MYPSDLLTGRSNCRKSVARKKQRRKRSPLWNLKCDMKKELQLGMSPLLKSTTKKRRFVPFEKGKLRFSVKSVYPLSES